MLPTSSSQRSGIVDLVEPIASTKKNRLSQTPRLTTPGGAPLVAVGSAFHGVTVDVARVLDAACGETDLITVQLTVDLRRVGAGLECSRKHLEVLFERQLTLRKLPCPVNFCRHDPKISGAPTCAPLLCLNGLI